MLLVRVHAREATGDRMSDIRCLYRPGIEPPGRGGGAPVGHGRDAQEARGNLAGFLDAALPRSIYADNVARQNQIEQSIETMTPAERVFLEIEMQERRRAYYSSDYDPLR